MSMNLGFRVVGSKEGYVDFPFQTPTVLSYEVMALASTEERVQRVHEWIDAAGWDPLTREETKKEVSALMYSPTLELDMS